MDLKCKDWSLTRREEGPEAQRRGGHVKTEVKVGLRLPQATERLGPCEAERKENVTLDLLRKVALLTP